MRWFWLFIALLIVLTGVLYTVRVQAERAEQEAMQALSESSNQGVQSRRPRDRDRTPETTKPDADPVVAQPETIENEEPTEQIAEQAQPKIIEPEVVEAPIEEPVEIVADEQPEVEQGREFNPGALITLMNEIGEQDQPETDPEPQNGQLDDALALAAKQTQGEKQAEKPEAPSYELRADGSFKVISANRWVQGAGTEAEPYVLGWDVLKSIESSYDPKKGKDKLPDWLDYLDGKVVSIEGNTLVPVVANTTRELLVMQNPWDGCCIGVPPTPYDAIEVVLNHDVDFGNSAVGFGNVQGIFYLDPYIVDGWVLGLYIIEDAQYRSGEGVVFPEF